MRVLRLPAVMERVGLCRMQIYRLEKDGRFPTKIRLGPNSIGWIENEVDEWIAERAAEREAGAA